MISRANIELYFFVLKKIFKRQHVIPRERVVVLDLLTYENKFFQRDVDLHLNMSFNFKTLQKCLSKFSFNKLGGFEENFKMALTGPSLLKISIC